MTVHEVARYLRVHTMTVYRLINRGDLPAMRVGHGWRFKKDVIDRWLQRHANHVNSNAAPPKSAQPRRSAKRREHGSR
jgi:excisionase family DNA binding protein